MSGVGMKTKAKVGGGAPPLASAPEGPRRTPPNGGDPRNAPEEFAVGHFLSSSAGFQNVALLGDIADIIMGQAPPGSNCNKDGLGTVFVKAGEFDFRFPTVREWTTNPLKMGRRGDVFVCVVGATAGKVNEGIDCAIGRSVAAVRPNTSKLHSAYLFHFLCTQVQTLRAKSQGMAQGVITREMLQDIRIPLPPLPEQRRIAEVLDRALSIRARRIESITRIELVSQSLFRDMFGDPIRNERGWEILPFGEVCETRLGKMLDQKQQTGQDSRPYLRNANVQWFRFDLESIHEMDFDKKSRETHSLQVGDLLICEGGEPGRCAIWRGQIQECYFQKALHRARPDLKKAAPEYLAWLLWCYSKGGGLKDYITSATIAHLTGEKLNVLPIALPPLALQRVFVERLKGIEKVKDAQLQSLTKIDCLFASLQHQAFHGEL